MGCLAILNVKIEMQGITKYFDTVTANKDVSLQVYEGEIHALLGENGAGKSTLMNMLSGIYLPDEGQILIDNKIVKIHTPHDAIKNKIGMIHQHFKLVDIFTAQENIIAGQRGGFFIDEKRVTADILALSHKYGIDIDPNKRVFEMSVGEKQSVEILKVLYRNARILIMDEPSSTLTPQETKKLFSCIRKMRDDGCSIIIITHKMNEVMEISDRVTVLRNGQTIGTVNTNETSPSKLIEMMVGRGVELEIKRVPKKESKTVFEVNSLNVKNGDGVMSLSNINFSISGGEILGVAGVAGSGQKELCETIAGLLKPDSGSVNFNGSDLIGKTPREIFDMGISMSFIPEDRLGMGLAGSLDIVDNVVLRSYQKGRGPFVDRRKARVKAQSIVDRLDVKTPSIYHQVRLLSGGNIQKVLLGREIDSSPDVLITAYPTRGLDIGVTHVIYDILNEQKQKGVAILYVGEDLDVLLQISDRIMVLCDGKLTGIVNASETTKEDVGLLMTGGNNNV